jgi:hypothetical protein
MYVHNAIPAALSEMREIKLKFTLEQSMKAQRVRRGTALLTHNLGTRRCGWLTLRPGLFTPGKEPQ